MANWRMWKVGEVHSYHVNDFDGNGVFVGIVKEVHEDHALLELEDMILWVEDFNSDMFR